MLLVVLLGLACGVSFGFVLQRGRFCWVSAYRDVFVMRDTRLFVGTMIAIAVQSMGVYTLSSFGIIRIPPLPFTWLGAIVGGFVFGCGMILAGGCASGSWYRMGEGLLGSWISLFGFMVSAAAVKFGVLQPVYQWITTPKGNHPFLYQSLGVSPWVLVGLFTLLTLIAVRSHLRRPQVRVPSLPPRKQGIAHVLFEKRWHPFVTGAIVGGIAILAWPLSEVTGRIGGLGITTPSAHLLGFLVTGNTKMLDWGVFLVLGIAIGSFIAAKASGEFRWRIPPAKTALTNLGGGLLMGFGAALAGGCNIGNGLVNTSLFTWQGWVATPAIILGCWFVAYWQVIRPMRTSAALPIRVAAGEST
ncbi:MAG: YeeE/YedE family protein [Firmicutes bacterium]|nr:YeeE/YedE family protein [Bacillota bacterium]